MRTPALDGIALGAFLVGVCQVARGYVERSRDLGRTNPASQYSGLHCRGSPLDGMAAGRQTPASNELRSVDESDFQVFKNAAPSFSTFDLFSYHRGAAHHCQRRQLAAMARRAA